MTRYGDPGHNHNVLIDFDDIFKMGPKAYKEQVFRWDRSPPGYTLQ